MRTNSLTPAALLVFFLLGRNAHAQEYFREFDTHPTGYPSEDSSVYTDPLYRAVDSGVPSQPPASTGETTLRFESTSHLEPAYAPTAGEEETYNWAIGPFRFNVTAGLGLEYNDNINLAPSGGEDSDFILRPFLTIGSVWRLSELNTLRFSLGASYAAYFSHSEYDSRSVLLSPQSMLALSVMVGDVRITLRDRFSYQEDPYDLVVLDNVATYRRFENQAGIQIDWAINPDLTLTAGYDHYNLWSFQEEFDSLQRTVDTVYVRPALQINSSIQLGLNTSVSRVDFSEDVQNDGVSYFAGPFLEAQITDSTSGYLEAGWQYFDFDNSGSILDSDNANTPYVRAEVVNQMSESFTHRLSFTRTAEVGYGTNYFELNHIEYSAIWEMNPSLIGTSSLFYDYYETSGDSGEAASRFGASPGLRYILTPSVTLGLDYRFLLKDSDLPNSDYRQNLVLLSLFYNF